MAELSRTFPQDVAWSIPYDTTPFVQISVEEVIITLVEAMVLVFVVMFLFLQNWRATLIPSIVVPIALAGACLGLWLRGLFDQRADPVRHGAGDRHPGRRRDRRDRECRAHHARRETAALRSDREGDGPDHLADHRHHAGADRGVRADGLLPRDDRRHLSPILADAGDFDRLLGAAGADADPGAVRVVPQAARRHASPRRDRAARRSLLRRLQRLVRAHARAATKARSPRSCRVPLRWLGVFAAAGRR